VLSRQARHNAHQHGAHDVIIQRDQSAPLRACASWGLIVIIAAAATIAHVSAALR
jgi:hypothetical protein